MIKTNIKVKIEYNSEDIRNMIAARLPLSAAEIGRIEIVRRSLNAKDKSNIFYDLQVAFELSAEREEALLKYKKLVSPYLNDSFTVPPSKLTERPVIIGAGPAGLFAALTLASAGARPILYERGLDVDGRIGRVELFRKLGILDPECNVQYGEGGAGTYSDGKLKAGYPDKYKKFVLGEFVSHGADPDVLYSTSAHVGTDKLSGIVKGIREKIISLGGEVTFGAKLTAINVCDGEVVGGRVEKNGEIIDFSTDKLILATGHSATDVFDILNDIGALLEPRGFGIGMRIEHPREYVDSLVLGDSPPPSLHSASYHLVTHLKNGRSVYSFCMCPGGEVVTAACQRGGIITNGMSEYKRDGDNSNSALLISVTPEDFGNDVFSGLRLQRSIEGRAFACTSGTYKAPAQRLDAFFENHARYPFASVKPSYALGVERINAADYLPHYITDSLRAGIRDFNDWMPGFYLPDATLTGPETRTTSPVRVTRTDIFESATVRGLYPIGEGAGYSGGIVSSARDGVMCAESILLCASEI